MLFKKTMRRCVGMPLKYSEYLNCLQNVSRLWSGSIFLVVISRAKNAIGVDTLSSWKLCSIPSKPRPFTGLTHLASAFAAYMDMGPSSGIVTGLRSYLLSRHRIAKGVQTEALIATPKPWSDLFYSASPKEANNSGGHFAIIRQVSVGLR